MKLSTISSALGTRIENGSPETEITGIAGIEAAGPGQLTFLSNSKYSSAARSSQAEAVIVAEDMPPLQTAMLRSKNPYFDFARALELFYRPPDYAPGIHPTAVIDPSAKIGAGAHVGPYVVIDEHVEIGRGAVLLAHVVIYRGVKAGDNFLAHSHAVVREFCRLGNNVILQNGVIVGGDGYGFAKDSHGRWHKIVQSGPAIIEDDVEIQANSCIDRASVGETRISRGTKIDNLVQVGHGSKVGQETLLCAQVGLAGSTRVGNNVILAGQVGVAGHCKIGDGVIATAQSGIPNDVAAKAVVSGYPAIDNKLWLRCAAVFNRLPEIAKRLRDK
ncbi:MAG: UDP-3-O-(3-hydroxymyristoyl)glucosamine N-acyltransferase [Acidobacteria bacterium]|nr:UDP-3-O-(3-hydroxymyristoyl)glucosamine N-acyltransferase [Acidobacteriota bacterium]MBV9622644.1 UDP-3-O-(3-hydroxymyristoyl)glucosamine N-acyltransferase [Acidobacteriota bacterium]